VGADFQLVQTERGLELVRTGEAAGICIDFAEGPLDYRVRYASKGKQMVLKAVGGPKVHGGRTRRVCDLTAGLGRDAFVLATGGCEVTALEQDPLIYQLLEDGWARALQSVRGAALAKFKLQFFNRDATEWLQSTTEKFDTLYIDPMFPPRKKSAAVKKEMVLLHEYFKSSPTDEAVAQLLDLARAKALDRVVLKRPRHAPVLGSPRHSLEGSAVRFDVYI
jgi:16S rRNA (guanine1516-N2)-methyltransferase